MMDLICQSYVGPIPNLAMSSGTSKSSPHIPLCGQPRRTLADKRMSKCIHRTLPGSAAARKLAKQFQGLLPSSLRPFGHLNEIDRSISISTGGSSYDSAPHTHKIPDLASNRSSRLAPPFTCPDIPLESSLHASESPHFAAPAGHFPSNPHTLPQIPRWGFLSPRNPHLNPLIINELTPKIPKWGIFPLLSLLTPHPSH